MRSRNSRTVGWYFHHSELATVFTQKSLVVFCQMLRLRKYPLMQGGFVSIPELVDLVSRRQDSGLPGFLGELAVVLEFRLSDLQARRGDSK